MDIPNLMKMQHTISISQSMMRLATCSTSVSQWQRYDESLRFSTLVEFAHHIQTPEDRLALVKAVVEGSGKFFFGSSSLTITLQNTDLHSSRKRLRTSPSPIQERRRSNCSRLLHPTIRIPNCHRSSRSSYPTRMDQ